MEGTDVTTNARVVLAGEVPVARLRPALARRGHRVAAVALESLLASMDEGVDAVLLAAPREVALAICSRLKTRFQIPFLPVLVLDSRPARDPSEEDDPTAPDAWLAPSTRPTDVVARIEELMRIRAAEREMARLNATLAEVAAENGRLYDRARRDAEATTLLLRELQHRVRNNLAAIQALLMLERHRHPARSTEEALDVAIARLRSMAALQDSLSPSTSDIDIGGLARSVARSTLDVFGAAEQVECHVEGGARLPSKVGSAIAIALNELVTNAIKHAEAHHVSVNVRATDREVELVVTDDGRGMPTVPGTGSGLMIVRTVVANELGGQLSFADGDPGTKVCITVPLQAAASA